MGLIGCASGKSIWRAIDYIKQGKVISWEQRDECYEGHVEGSNGEIYEVNVNHVHPRKSSCICPFAKDRRVICKHMLAIYFLAEPQKLDEFYRLVEDEEEQERLRQKKYVEDLYKQARMYSKEELIEKLVSA